MTTSTRRTTTVRDARCSSAHAHDGNRSRGESSMGVMMLYADRASDASFVIDNRTTQMFAVRDLNFTSLFEARVDVRRV